MSPNADIMLANADIMLADADFTELARRSQSDLQSVTFINTVISLQVNAVWFSRPPFLFLL